MALLVLAILIGVPILEIALFIQVGTLYLALVAGFAWTTSK